MSLKEEILKVFTSSEKSFLEDEIGTRLFEQNSMLHSELDNLLDIYEMLQDTSTLKTPALPSLSHNSRDKSLLCVQILTLISELKKLGIKKISSQNSNQNSSQNSANIPTSAKPSKDLIKFCIANQSPQIEDSDVNDETNPSASIRQIVLTKLHSVRTLRPKLKQYSGKVHDIPNELFSLVREDVETENEILHAEIKLVNQALSDPRSISRGSIENTRNFTVEDLKFEIKNLERSLARKSSLEKIETNTTGNPIKSKLRPSPPTSAEIKFRKPTKPKSPKNLTPPGRKMNLTPLTPTTPPPISTIPSSRYRVKTSL